MYINKIILLPGNINNSYNFTEGLNGTSHFFYYQIKFHQISAFPLTFKTDALNSKLRLNSISFVYSGEPA
jgi:hypothetical protein